MRGQLTADSVDDAAIRARIGADHAEFGRNWCPHTATAAEVYRRLPRRGAARRLRGCWSRPRTRRNFNEIVEPLIGEPVAVPRRLARLLELPQQFLDLPPDAGGASRRRWNERLCRIEPRNGSASGAAADRAGRRRVRGVSRLPAACATPLAARASGAHRASQAAHQVQVPDGMGGYIHVDHLLLTPRGLLVLDTRRVSRD